MQKFAGEPEQKPGEQWQGSDAGTPGTKLVGECDQPVTLADKLRARWEETKAQKGLQEYGMTTGGTAMGGGTAPAVDTAQQAKQTAQVQQNVNKLKSAGVNIPNVGQAVQSVMKEPTDPATSQDKNVSAGLGQEIDQVLTKGNPSEVNQLAALIRKVKQGQ